MPPEYSAEVARLKVFCKIRIGVSAGVITKCH